MAIIIHVHTHIAVNNIHILNSTYLITDSILVVTLNSIATIYLIWLAVFCHIQPANQWV